MEKQIWKYPLPNPGKHRIEMPIGAECLSVHVQNGVPCLWAMIDPLAALSVQEFEVFETGQPLDGTIERKYFGTFMLFGGKMVYHLFHTL